MKKQAKKLLAAMVCFSLVGCTPANDAQANSAQTEEKTVPQTTTTQMTEDKTAEQTTVQTEPPAPIEGVNIGDIATDFTLKNFEGDDISLSDYRGKTVILNFFASWCGPCQAETPDLNEVYIEERANDVVVLSVNLTGSSKTEAEDAKAFIEEKGVEFPVVLDQDGAVSLLYNVRGIPTNIFINKEGIIVVAIPGAMDKATFLTYLDAAKGN